jgi:hypothetical protein
MRRRSPILAGLAAVFRHPALWIAEISWRWALGASAILLGLLVGFEFLKSLPVTAADARMFGSGQIIPMTRALADILGKGLSKGIAATLVLIAGLTVGWVLTAAVGRGASIRALLGEWSQHGEGSAPGRNVNLSWAFSSLVGLNCLRIALFIAGIFAFAAVLILSSIVPSVAGANIMETLGPLLGGFLVFSAWSMLDRLLRFGSIFAVRNGADSTGAVIDAVNTLHERWSRFLTTETFFSAARVAAFALTAVGILILASQAQGRSPFRIVTAILVLCLCYFVVSDFLQLARLAAYIYIIEEPHTLLSMPPAPPVPPLLVEPSAAVDQTESILSDMPLTDPGLSH